MLVLVMAGGLFFVKSVQLRTLWQKHTTHKAPLPLHTRVRLADFLFCLPGFNVAFILPVQLKNQAEFSSSMRLKLSGDVVPKDVNAAVATIKTKRTIQFVDWHLARMNR